MSKGKSYMQYSGEFKEQVLKDVRENKLSYAEAMIKYDIRSRSAIQRWERIYIEEGSEGLYIERRGRAIASSGVNKGRPAKLGKVVEEDLIAENQRLRMEIDYLKKLNALVQERQHQARKPGQSGS